MSTSGTPFKPAHMHTVSPHLICNDAIKAMEFYKAAFGAEELARLQGPDGKLMHGCLKICGSTVMLVDEFPAMGVIGPQGLQTSPVTIHLYVEDVDAFLARAEKAGARVTMPAADMFWGDRYGTLVDPFGHRWSVATHKKALTEEETRAALMDAIANAPSEPGCVPPKEKDAFVISRDFDAPRDAVWKAFTEVDRLKQWWGPKGVSISHAMLDLRPGGLFHYCMETPTGERMWGRFVYRDISAPHRIVFVSSFSDAQGGVARHPLAPSWPREMISRFEFTDVGGKTRFTVVWMPLNATPEEQATFDAGHASMQQGWTGTMEKLADYLAANARPARQAS